MTNRFPRLLDHSPASGSILLAALILLLACNGGREPTGAPPVATPVRVSISPNGLSIVVGDAESLHAQAHDATGQPIGASFEWSSANPAVASVGTRDGVVTAISVGTTTVTATTGTVSAAVSVSVLHAGPASLSIAGSALGLFVGEFDRLTVQVFDAKGRTITAPVEWSSANAAVATVGKNDGVVTGASVGSTTVTVNVGALSATAAISVLDEVAGSIAFTRFNWQGSGPNGTIGALPEALSYSASDRTIRPLVSDPYGLAAPTWSPDGALLAVEVIRDAFGDPGEGWLDYSSNVYVLSLADPFGSSSRALTKDGISRSPSWSPDGSRIAYVRGAMASSSKDIYLVSALGGAASRLTRSPGDYSVPRWSADGSRVAFADCAVGNCDILIINADGSGLTNVTRSSATDVDPSWSPDGAHLAFSSNRDSSRDIFVVDADGTNLRRLTNAVFGGSSSAPTWSPDGRHIAFAVRAARESRSGIYVMTAEGSAPARITRPAANWDIPSAWKR